MATNDDSPIAHRTLIAIDAQGNEFTLTISVGRPYPIDRDHEWACPVEMTGLHKRLRDPVGVDSWQALQLAYQLIGQMLGYFVEDGGSLYWPVEREPVSVDDLLPKLPPGAT